MTKQDVAVIGVGGAGGNLINMMVEDRKQGVSYIAANTDAQALAHSQADTKIQLGVKLTEGLGAGAKPEIGKLAALEVIGEIQDQLEGIREVYITAGMGGGTGTGAAPVIAAAARSKGLRVVSVVTKPIKFEGRYRKRTAKAGIKKLKRVSDQTVTIDVEDYMDPTCEHTYATAFFKADKAMASAVEISQIKY